MQEHHFYYKLLNFLVHIITVNEEDVTGFNIKIGAQRTNNCTITENTIIFTIHIYRTDQIRLMDNKPEGHQQIHTTFQASSFTFFENGIFEIYKNHVLAVNNFERHCCDLWVSTDFQENNLIIGSIALKHFNIFISNYGYYTLHASAFYADDFSVICSAQGGNGKSTIIYQAQKLGYSLSADDRTIIDSHKWELLNCFSSIGLDYSLRSPPRLTDFSVISEATEAHKTYYCVQKISNMCETKPLHVSVLLFPELGDGPPSASLITPENAYRRLLMNNSYMAQIYSKAYFSFLLGLAKRSVSFHVMLNRTTKSYQFIDEFLKQMRREKNESNINKS